jgi:hypothetical protein
MPEGVIDSTYGKVRLRHLSVDFVFNEAVVTCEFGDMVDGVWQPRPIPMRIFTMPPAQSGGEAEIIADAKRHINKWLEESGTVRRGT